MSRPQQGDERTYRVEALIRALDVLGLVAEKGYDVSLAELVAELRVPKSTVFRYLRSLVAAGYLVHDAPSDRYHTGPRFLLLARRAEFFDRLRRAVRPEIEQIFRRFGRTTNLGVLQGGRILYLDIIEKRHQPEMKARVGSQDSLHSTALGKAILAYLPASERDELLRHPLTEFTLRTITSRSKLRRELELVAARGYALDTEENEDGAMCVGVPILCGPRYPVAAISLSAVVRPRSKLPLEEVVQQLVRSAAVSSIAFDGVHWSGSGDAPESIRPPAHLSQLFAR